MEFEVASDDARRSLASRRRFLGLMMLGAALPLLAACGASCNSRSGEAATACRQRMQVDAQRRVTQSGFGR